MILLDGGPRFPLQDILYGIGGAILGFVANWLNWFGRRKVPK